MRRLRLVGLLSATLSLLPVLIPGLVLPASIRAMVLIGGSAIAVLSGVLAALLRFGRWYRRRHPRLTPYSARAIAKRWARTHRNDLGNTDDWHL